MSDEIEQITEVVEESAPPIDNAPTPSDIGPYPGDEGDGSAVDLGIPDAGASLFRDNFTSPSVKADQHV